MIEKVCTLLLVNLLFFCKSITYKYCSDDIPSSRREHSKPRWKHWLFVFEGREKSTMQADHALTTALHALASVGVYLGFGADDVSFLGALLFSFNPINNQGSVWLSGRSYVLPTIAITFTMAFPVLAPALLLGSAYYNCGFLSPLVLLFTSHPWVVAWMPLVWLFHSRRFKKNVGEKIAQEAYAEDMRIHWQKLVLVTKTFGFYTLHALIPVKTTFYHSFLQSAAGAGKMKARSMKDRFFFFGLFFIGLAVWILIRYPGTMLSFGVIWWIWCLLPFLNIFRIHQEIAERYTYLPLPGIMIALASVIHPFPIVWAVVLAVYATKLWFYMDNYTDDYYLVEGSCLNSPDSWFGWHVRAMKRWDTGSHKEALILWTMARMISPNEFKLNFNIATCLKLAKHDEEAEKFMYHAQSNIPGGQEKMGLELVKEWRAGKLNILL